MTGEQFDKLLKALEQIEEGILLTKGADYTQSDGDRLKNFKRLGEELLPIFRQLSPGLKDDELRPMATRCVFWVYFRKHIDAIQTYIVTGQVESEGLMGRINDARNYLALLAGLAVDFKDMQMPGGDA